MHHFLIAEKILPAEILCQMQVVFLVGSPEGKGGAGACTLACAHVNRVAHMRCKRGHEQVHDASGPLAHVQYSW